MMTKRQTRRTCKLLMLNFSCGLVASTFGFIPCKNILTNFRRELQERNVDTKPSKYSNIKPWSSFSWNLHSHKKSSRDNTTVTTDRSEKENAADAQVLGNLHSWSEAMYSPTSLTKANSHTIDVTDVQEVEANLLSQARELELHDNNDGGQPHETNNGKYDENQWLKILSTEVGLKKFLNEPSQPDLPVDVLVSRTLDTIEDVGTHLRRVPYDLGWAEEEEEEAAAADETKKQTVVVLGSGWAAHALMKVADTFAIRLIVISPVNHFVFTPMLAAAAVGSVEYRSMTEAVRASNPMIEFIEGKAIDVDVEKKSLKVELNSLLVDTYADWPAPEPIELNYDSLVCAVGTKVRNSMVPGAKEHCYYLKTCEDSRRLRTAIGEALEYASRPDVSRPEMRHELKRRVTFCIVGGGPTGVELAGELSDFFRDICKPRTGSYPLLADHVRVMLVHGGSELVDSFDPNLREHAIDALKRRGVEVRMNTYTTEVSGGSVKLKDKLTGEEEIVPVGITVWAAGIEPVPFCKKLLEQLPDSAYGAGGRINVDKWMRAPTKTKESAGSIFVLGDAAYFDEGNGQTLPQTAQVAGQQGAYVARLLNRRYNMTTTPPILPQDGPDSSEAELQMWLRLRGLDEASGFQFLNLGLLAYLGGGEALSQVQIGDTPIFSYAGSVAFVLWRSVYLVKQVATRNRVLVTFDWFKTLLFGRDVTRL